MVVRFSSVSEVSKVFVSGLLNGMVYFFRSFVRCFFSSVLGVVVLGIFGNLWCERIIESRVFIFV